MLRRRTVLIGLSSLFLPLAGAAGTLSGTAALAAGRDTKPVFTQKGKASWYGPGLGSRRTASGERLDQRRLTAAHKTLPFGCKVCVTHVETGSTVEVTINDRGPHVRGRIIDLSPAAARRLDMRNEGLAHVVITAYSDAQPNEDVRRALVDHAGVSLKTASRNVPGPVRNRRPGRKGGQS